MTDTLENVLTTKDFIEISYWVISFLLLCITAYAVYFAPLKAVKIGRKLNDEQNQLKAKSDLFLNLFALRGNPTSHTFVNALNQIEIVFQGEPSVLNAWDKLYDSMNNKSLTNPSEIWNLLRTDLLSEMAQSLGYKKLKQTSIQKSYIPIAHENHIIESLNHQQAEKLFFETATKLHNILIETYQINQQLQTDEIQKIS